MKGKLTRRSLISQASLGTATFFILADSRSVHSAPASQRINVALNEFLMLGNVATQVEEQIDFDPLATKIVNNARADALLRSEYRQGWSV